MKKKYIAVGLVAAILGGSLSSCIGSFTLTNKLLSWNQSIGNKFVNELVFIAFWVLPVYEVSALADVLVLNSIEFWSGSNPLAKKTTKIQGQNGEYLVKCDGKGYDITGPDGVVTRLDFNADTQEWSVMAGDEKVVFLTFVDDTHVKLPGFDGSEKIVETSQAGVYAYTQYASAASDLALR